MTARKNEKRSSPPPEPVNVIDGLPDRSPRPTWWKYAIPGGIFVAWVAFLVYTAAAGSRGI